MPNNFTAMPNIIEEPRLDVFVSAKVTQADKATLEEIAAIEQLKLADIVRRALRFYMKHWRREQQLEDVVDARPFSG